MRPNVWGWWLGLTVVGGIVGEFLAAIPATAVGRFISDFDNGQLIKIFPFVGFIEPLFYGLLCGIGLGVCHWFIDNRMYHVDTPQKHGWLWITSWMVVVVIELIFRKAPFDDPWITQSIVLGLVVGSIGGGIQWFILRYKLKYALIWIMSSSSGLMLGFSVFRLFVHDKLWDINGIYDSSYYIGRLYQWAIYGLITSLTLELLVRATNNRRL